MANRTINDLTLTGGLNSTDSFELQEAGVSGVSRRVTLALLDAYFSIGAQDTYKTFDADTGTPTTANSPTDTLTIVGGTNIDTVVSNDIITINSSAGGGGTVDNITADSGGATTGANVILAGGTDIGTVRSGDTVTINSTAVPSLASLGYISVKEYGASGDKTQDDTFEIQEAFNAAAAAAVPVYFPTGIYRISSTIEAKVPFFGTGGAYAGGDKWSPGNQAYPVPLSLIKNDSINDGSPMFNMDGALYGAVDSFCRVHDIFIDGNQLDCVGIYHHANDGIVGWCQYSRVTVRQCTVGLKYVGFGGSFDHCFMYRNTLYGLYCVATAHATYIRGGEYSSISDETPLPTDGNATAWAICIAGNTRVVSLDGVTIESRGSQPLCNGLLITENVSDVSLSNMYFENHEGSEDITSYHLDVGSVAADTVSAPANTLASSVHTLTMRNLFFGNQFTSGSPEIMYKGAQVRIGNVQRLKMDEMLSPTAYQWEISDQVEFPSVAVGTAGNSGESFTNSMWLSDNTAPTSRVAQPVTNFIVNPTFKGGPRGFQDVTYNSGCTAEEDVTVTRNGISSLKVTAPIGGSNSYCRLEPYGQEAFLPGGMVVINGWFNVPDIGSYSDSSDYARLGLYWNDGQINVEVNILAGLGQRNYFEFNTWTNFTVWQRIAPGSVDVSFIVYPHHVGVPAGLDHYLYVSDVVMAFNPSSIEDVMSGRWVPEHRAGILIGEQIHVSASAAPTDAQAKWLIGDTVHNTTPTAGGNMGWVCVENGSPGTWKEFGVIEV
jgi:hypothetical protein